MEHSSVNEAKVTVNKGEVTVSFIGVWTKREVDIAHKAMLRYLPAHIAGLRTVAESETPNHKENSK